MGLRSEGGNQSEVPSSGWAFPQREGLLRQGLKMPKARQALYGEH